MRSRRRVYSAVMHLVLKCLRIDQRRRLWLTRQVRELWLYGCLCVRSLVYNSFADGDTALDALFEPIYWLVFVALVITLTTSVVCIVYIYLLPLILQTYPVAWIFWHFIYGHWNLIMIVFHYYMAITTQPGYPPQQSTSDVVAVSICKKCIAPKPARTHHCSICNKCILKMDHHCRILPEAIRIDLGSWLNNCVGHYNHRYFFSFMLFMTMGCIYSSVSGWDMFWEAYAAIETYSQTPPPTFSFGQRTFHKSIVYAWVLCRHFYNFPPSISSSVALALGALMLWHSVLITRGETSIERHINRKERKRLQKGKVFRNPYNYGPLGNWKVFLGVEKQR
ncbi:hypothetical protein JD844_006987 [Phrynosoma platyrhinos]|uniref:Palmitoyltransferase n=1 Tax=Phrynosoma platyrhinos TaxID=52577 RepID=A0ABQ7T2Q3_PHRPL|nr:hypothetical protein JD844_006987 [Phrynosoma platyrhinos]